MEIQEYIDIIKKEIYTIDGNYNESKITTMTFDEEKRVLKIVTEKEESLIGITTGLLKNKEGQHFKIAFKPDLN